jgi:hypothetical protein
MKTIFLHLIAVFVLAGCATSMERQHLERGDLVEAYATAVNGYAGQKADEKNRVISEVLSKTGGDKDTKFMEMLKTHIENRVVNEWYFSTFPGVLIQAKKDGLISSAQQTDANDLLQLQIEKASIHSPFLLENTAIRAAFPKLGMHRAKIAQAAFERIQLDRNSSLEQYFPIYRLFADSKDEASAQLVRVAMRQKAEDRLKASRETAPSLSLIQPILEYVKLTADRTLDPTIVALMMKVKLTRLELTKGDVPTLFPAFAQEKIERSIVKIDITSPKDEFIVGEIIEELKKANEWLEVSDDSNRKLIIGRIRFQEDRSNPVNMTETVQNPNLLTVMMIPNNASVLFDYSTAEYSVQWNMGITDSKSRGVKAISGQRKGKKVECRNMRYQNVFGGTGSLYSMPNDAVANFCQSSSGVDFDQIRASAISEIASEINRTFLIAP